MIKDRPILFSAPMVRACLREDNPKTVTRRIYKPRGKFPCMDGEKLPDGGGSTWMDWGPCPYGLPGDQLWVREAFSLHGTNPGFQYAVFRDGGQKSNDGMYSPGLKACAPGAFDGIKWKPSIHMPRWASRLSLEVTGVKVERLQDITEDEAKAEGAELMLQSGKATWFGDLDEYPLGYSRKSGFMHLWESINGVESWKANPWVWAVSFKRVIPEDLRDKSGTKPIAMGETA